MARKRIQGGKKEEREMVGLPQRPPDGGTPLPSLEASRRQGGWADCVRREPRASAAAPEPEAGLVIPSPEACRPN